MSEPLVQLGANGENAAAPHPAGICDSSFTEWSKDEVAQTLAERFGKQVALYPDHVAVRTEQSEITYRELNQRANRLAHWLLRDSSLADRPVALLLSQGVPEAAAILGVLKSGRVCVVLASSHPRARLKEILADAGAEVLVTDEAHLSTAREAAGVDVRVVNVDALGSGLPEENPGLVLSPDAPAFIIYTSGSTGRPRGVLQTHRNILHNIRRHTHGLRLHAGDRISLLSSCSTGQGMATMFCALLNGATLCGRNLGEKSVAGLGDWLNGEQITVYISAGTVFRHFIGSLNPRQQFPRVRVVRLASEPVLRHDFDLFCRHFHAHCLFANTYSSTETGNLCQFFLTPESPLPADTIPIGRPVEDVEILLWDEQGQAVEPGSVGEIVVRSRYLSPGYWRNAEQTNAAFTAVPGCAERLYRTRDLGRLRPDGLFEHCGRADTQVKIRGYRVYPDEVKRRLAEHPDVADVFVDAPTDLSGQSRLAAFVVARPGARPTVPELRRFMRDSLPEFMVPSQYVFLDAFPRTPNGKVDRMSLRERKAAEVPTPVGQDAAKTPMEELLTGVWAEMLNLETVGIHDSFFDLGGDSLLVTRLTLRIQEVLGRTVSPALLFAKPTVAALCASLQQPASEPASARPGVSAASRNSPLPLSFAQERNWRHSQNHRDSLSNLLANGFEINGALDADALQQSLDEMIRRHEPLRTRYGQTSDGLVQIIGPPAPATLRRVDLALHAHAEQQAEEVWWEEARKPIDLEHGPMLRATLIRLHETKHWLLLTVHHIISDAWSRDNFLRDLSLLYAGFAEGRAPRLPEPQLHYADFAVWQRELLRDNGPIHREQFVYWQRQLAKAPARLHIPFARRQPEPEADFRSGRIPYCIPAELAHRLQTIGRQQGATLFMTRLAAFAAHLHDITGADDLVVATYMTNRTQPEVERMIGFFSNLVMLRLDLTGNPTFNELLRRIRQTTLDATGHSDIAFEELCAGLKQHGTRPPKIQVIFESTLR